MLLNRRRSDDHVRVCSVGFLVYAAAALSSYSDAKDEFEGCEMSNGSLGICRVFQECQPLVEALQKGEISINDPKSCGYKGKYELVCCPTDQPVVIQTTAPFVFDRITHTTTTTKKPKPAVRTERPAVAACRAIEENLNPYLTPQILDGTPVASGEYPHMAAIGYSSISEEGGPYDFRCGGALIHERFVLTAAHCVNSRNATPAIVRLGMVDFDDPDQIPNRAEIPIKEIHIHDNYSSRRKYDDIALLELQENVKFSTYIYPACLYTDPGDPPADAQLYVTGWGTVNTTTRKRSNILLKAQLKIEPLDNCNTSYVEFGLTRQLDRGVLDTQICARDPGYTKDACQGDSGGPLNMVVDETTGNFRIVGVISTGFGCASAIPGLYTRVSAYLDFIESKIWPSE